MEEESLPTPDDHGSNPVIDNSNELSTVLKIHNKKKRGHDAWSNYKGQIRKISVQLENSLKMVVDCSHLKWYRIKL